jgi:hypothetical protein
MPKNAQQKPFAAPTAGQPGGATASPAAALWDTIKPYRELGMLLVTIASGAYAVHNHFATKSEVDVLRCRLDAYLHHDSARTKFNEAVERKALLEIALPLHASKASGISQDLGALQMIALSVKHEVSGTR